MDKQIFDDIKRSDFERFNQLNEEEQIALMKTWNQEIWIKFRMQNTVSEEDVFEPILKLIDSDD